MSHKIRPIKTLIIILTIVADIYIMGAVDLFNPVFYALIFMAVNYLVYYFCYKRDKEAS